MNDELEKYGVTRVRYNMKYLTKDVKKDAPAASEPLASEATVSGQDGLIEHVATGNGMFSVSLTGLGDAFYVVINAFIKLIMLFAELIGEIFGALFAVLNFFTPADPVYVVNNEKPRPTYIVVDKDGKILDVKDD